ncbi:MAG: hypothetical protein JWP10_1822 [Nocardioidaceae bacterium]|nr:hypothetical protein [Nocardioidaceae bacterium]
MDDTTFEIDPSQVAAASKLFPASLKTVPVKPGDTDLKFLAEGKGDFSDHCWDENGHL